MNITNELFIEHLIEEFNDGMANRDYDKMRAVIDKAKDSDFEETADWFEERLANG